MLALRGGSWRETGGGISIVEAKPPEQGCQALRLNPRNRRSLRRCLVRRRKLRRLRYRPTLVRYVAREPINLWRRRFASPVGYAPQRTGVPAMKRILIFTYGVACYAVFL